MMPRTIPAIWLEVNWWPAAGVTGGGVIVGPNGVEVLDDVLIIDAIETVEVVLINIDELVVLDVPGVEDDGLEVGKVDDSDELKKLELEVEDDTTDEGADGVRLGGITTVEVGGRVMVLGAAGREVVIGFGDVEAVVAGLLAERVEGSVVAGGMLVDTSVVVKTVTVVNMVVIALGASDAVTKTLFRIVVVSTPVVVMVVVTSIVVVEVIVVVVVVSPCRLSLTRRGLN